MAVGLRCPKMPQLAFYGVKILVDFSVPSHVTTKHLPDTSCLGFPIPDRFSNPGFSIPGTRRD